MSKIIQNCSKRAPYAVIQFADSTVEIIKTSWAFFNAEDGKIASTIFPDVNTKQELEVYLEKDDEPANESWYNNDGNSYVVVETFSYAESYEMASDRLNYYLNLFNENAEDLMSKENMEKNEQKKGVKRITQSKSEDENISNHETFHASTSKSEKSDTLFDENPRTGLILSSTRQSKTRRISVADLNVKSKYKTPRFGYYSTRHMRRIVDQHSKNMQQLTEDCTEKFIENVTTIGKSQFISSSEEVGVQCFNEIIDSHDLSHGSADNSKVPLLQSQLIIANDDSENEISYSNLDAIGINDSSSDEELNTFNVDIDETYGNFQQTQSLNERLRDWALKFDITLIALSALLLLLNVVLNVNLPFDARTLLGTMRKTEVIEIEDGIYHHFGLKRAIKNILQEIKDKGEERKEIKLIINIDGVPISKSGSDTVWIILCSEANCKNVYPIGASLGKSKPKDANEFLGPFVEEAISICQEFTENPDIRVSLEAVICDAPAKSFVFYSKGHTGYGSCSKCFYVGDSILPERPARGKKPKRRVCFPRIRPFRKRSDKDFFQRNCSKRTVLTKIPRFGCVTSVPLDYLHLILLGVMKTLIRLWLTGPQKCRLKPEQSQSISESLLLLRLTMPTEFNRKPRTLLEYKHWKGTEFRSFLLYSGVVVLQNNMDEKYYKHFLLLHTAISILVSKNHMRDVGNIDYAHELLTRFVKEFSVLYGKEFISHNVHNLLHLCDDAKKYGVSDNFSAFKFENYLSLVKRMIRSGNKPLQQIARRYSEMENAQKINGSDEQLILQQPHIAGPTTANCIPVLDGQFKVLKCNDFRMNCNGMKDNCVLLKDGTFLVIENIVKLKDNEHHSHHLIGRKLEFIDSLYEEPDSRLFNIHIMDFGDEQLQVVPFQDVAAKVWKIPSTRGHIVIPLLHYC